jgi:hypothetical protein
MPEELVGVQDIRVQEPCDAQQGSKSARESWPVDRAAERRCPSNKPHFHKSKRF